jgi:protocatechuate 3,4-dioxygenase beta subunit
LACKLRRPIFRDSTRWNRWENVSSWISNNNDNGTANFNTIYPGWYEGRAIHIHVKVSTFDGPNEKSEWTSQFYLNDTISEDVYKQLPYSKHGLSPITNEEDGIYTGPSTDGLIQNNTGQYLMLNLTKNKQGFNGTFNIVLNATNTEK